MIYDIYHESFVMELTLEQNPVSSFRVFSWLAAGITMFLTLIMSLTELMLDESHDEYWYICNFLQMLMTNHYIAILCLAVLSVLMPS